MGKRLLLVMAVAAGALMVPTAALAEETTCTGTIGATTLDNVRVPDGATCTLDGTRVKGTVKVETGATLIAKGIRVVGNVQAENASKVTVKRGSRVNGDIQHVQGGSARVVDTIIGGQVLFDENGGRLRAKRNVIEGNLQAFKNSGGLRIAKNTIDGNLQCKENAPAPTGGGNVVHGNKEDQCASL
jgi:cytoskeletal protein CcmA (bactofilin family)